MSYHLFANNYLLQTVGTTTMYSLKRITNSIIDIDNPSGPPTSSSVSYTIRSFPGKYKKTEIDGSTIKSDDIKLYVDPTDLTVKISTDDKIVNGSDELAIVDVTPYYDKDVICLYILQVRK